MTVRVRSVPPCVSSQIGSRHLPLKQGIVSSSLTWRTNFQCRKPGRQGGHDCGSKPLLTRGLLTRSSLERRTTMPYKKLPIGGAHSEILSWANHDFSIEEQSMLRNVSRLPCLFKHVALMPDAHLGKGSMVGSVIATKEAVIPATVGVDIGCGMMAVKTPFKSGILDGKLKDLRLAIEEEIPVGFNAYKESVDESSYWDGWKDFHELHEGVRDRKAKAMKQLGTLGGGNHFIEVCLDTENFVWLMLHSGSRNIGKELAERHISTAKCLWRLSELPAPDLAYFIQGTPEFAAYWKDLKWAQTYAMKNREIMAKRLSLSFRSTVITTTLRSKSTMAKKFSSRARAQSTLTKTRTASFPDRWARNRSS